MGRNRAVARDLENLPLEIIDEVIKEVDFERLIRLSAWAVPQFTLALEISPSWKHYFRDGKDRKAWLRSLRLTDDWSVLCFDSKDVPYPDRMKLRFLQSTHSWAKTEPSLLQEQWLVHLTKRLCEESCRKKRWLECLGAYLSIEERRVFEHIRVDSNTMSIEQLDSSVQLHRKALLARKETLATELQRLATLYQENPQLLKEPSAPQDVKPNVRHITQQFQSRATKIQQASPTLLLRARSRTYFQNDSPALVPYDWTLRFLVAVMRAGQTVIGDKIHFVLEGMATHYLCGSERLDDTQTARTVGTPWSLSPNESTQAMFLAGKSSPTRGRAGSYSAHSEIELLWLESFVEVIASLIQSWPQAAGVAKAGGSVKEIESSVLAEALEKRLDLSR